MSKNKVRVEEAESIGKSKVSFVASGLSGDSHLSFWLHDWQVQKFSSAQVHRQATTKSVGRYHGQRDAHAAARHHIRLTWSAEMVGRMEGWHAQWELIARWKLPRKGACDVHKIWL